MNVMKFEKVRKLCYKRILIIKFVEIIEHSQHLTISIAPYHTYIFQLSIQDKNLRWSKYARSKDISCIFTFIIYLDK
jgi:hypothetical protein